MRHLIKILFICLPLIANSEEFSLADGRTVDLRSDGTYSFVDGIDQILITASGCKNHLTVSEDKDEFKNLIGYKYFTGFSIQYKIYKSNKFRNHF